ncbi:MAG: ferrochelatase [Candidatus Marinimicrobia bacterium]|nr:ferrochelatase [Candidatus Neomarinimicrobiota bacterium]|tara:strand:- start:103 stop:1113 length:1011 start_codon:yes stop_codon:yes gene_type:complete
MDKEILLINLGSPKSLSIKHIRKYLNEFLSDDHVIDLPKYIQQFILRSFILPFRPKQAKEAYEQIWTKAGSPLINNTKLIANSLMKKTGLKVKIAMRYQEPSIESQIKNIKNKGIKELVVIPLYPHHAMSTTVSTELEFNRIVETIYSDLDFKYVKPFYDNPKYIFALSETIKPFLNKNPDKIIFSYHGIPERHIKKSDLIGNHCLINSDCCQINCLTSENCYRSNVFTTSKLVAEYLNLDNDIWDVTFQSRVSIIDPRWLKPYTDKEFIKLGKSTSKNIAVICPSFIADCLETLEEINIRGRKSFLESGGISFNYIPCLNNNSFFIELLEELINK